MRAFSPEEEARLRELIRCELAAMIEARAQSALRVDDLADFVVHYPLAAGLPVKLKGFARVSDAGPVIGGGPGLSAESFYVSRAGEASPQARGPSDE
jgi:hypothetical protein